MHNKMFVVTLLLMNVLWFLACSQHKISATATEEERMNAALKLFEKGDYFEAKTQFRILTLSNSGSIIADKAQFYLADCHFNMKEYILSASEYERLLKVYPSSEYTDDAKFKIGLSYFKLSPKSGLDQDYTDQAITHFQEFLEDYHSSNLAPEVDKYLQQARNKLAEKIYLSADLYRKMSYYQAANIYFNKVIEEYYDTDFAALALYWIADNNRAMHQYTQAFEIFDEFLLKYPDHDWVNRAQNKIKQTRTEYEKYTRHQLKMQQTQANPETE
ncbi:MAG: outer membrane protein assembly factor BamD [Calditrichaeota bacterium]|nr:MAG: outer membrane protein assembly factor BamD [Calditrichota bacterium]